MRSLLRSQLRLGVTVLVVLAIAIGSLPLLFTLEPDLEGIRVLTVRCSRVVMNDVSGCTLALWREGPGLTALPRAGLTFLSHLPAGAGLLVGSASVAVRPTGGQSCEVHRGVDVPVQDRA
ncbi:MAG: hypothetical protein QG622_2175, partial [Actinomycetota bacterium]|nr:hypothetical protein [Actinomycetota bacterium]